MISVTSLIRFPRFGGPGLDPRADYQKQTGTQAPPFDPSKPPKCWLDPGGTQATAVSYLRLPHPGEKLELVSFSLTGPDAASVNLPGRVLYPAYNPPPLNVTRGVNPLGGGLPIFATIEYATLADGLRLMAELNGTNLREDNQSPGGEGVVYGPGETRRRYVIDVGGQTELVGELVHEQYANGVGAPGKWMQGSGGLQWVSAASVTQASTWSNDLPEVDVPVRGLSTGESLVRAGQDGGLYVQTAGVVDEHPPQLPAHFEAEWASLRAEVSAIRDALHKVGVG